MNKHITRALFALLVVFGFTSCEKILEKEYDSPPSVVIPDGMILSVTDLAQIVADSGAYRFTDDFNLYAHVGASGGNGNIYKNFYAQDDSTGMNISTEQDGGIYTGDYFRLNLNGMLLTRDDNDMLFIDSVDVDDDIVIQANEQYVTPTVTTLAELNDEMLGMLVQIENVEMSPGELGQPYAISNAGTGEAPQNVNRILQDCDGNTIIVRNSGYSDFADEPMPFLNGTITAVYAKYGDDNQLFIRDPQDLDFPNLRCDGSSGVYEYFKDFSDEELLSGGWSQEVVAGTNDWYIGFFAGNAFAKASNYNGGSYGAADIWLISEPYDLTTINDPKLIFETSTNFNGPQMETYVSTDFDPTVGAGGVGAATWTLLQADYSPEDSGYERVSSGAIDLGAHISDSTYVGFRYIGGTNDGATWQVDNIGVFGF